MKKENLKSISIVTPIFNRVKDIENIKYNLRILEKELKEYEFIIVDDCSSDNTREAIQLFMKRTLEQQEQKMLEANTHLENG